MPSPALSPNPWRHRRWLRGAMGLLLALAGVAAIPAAPAQSKTAPSAPAVAHELTTAEAAVQAHSTGTPVEVTGATTATSTLTANPNGTFTMRTWAAPQRKRVNGVWQALDATLRPAPDGTLAPAVAYGGLALSGGGDGPLATMADATRSVALTLPWRLPKPVLDGPTATYSDVLPGVDLRATADTTGGFSEVLVVRDAKAAADPRLKRIEFATRTAEVDLKTDAAGNLVGTDRNGDVVVTAPTPYMWDSASRIRRLGVAAGSSAVTLTPDAGLITAADTVFPLYIDPTYSWVANSPLAGWANIQSGSGHATNYWKNTPGGGSDLLSGRVPGGGGAISRSLVSFTIDTTKLAGASIGSATLELFETWAYNCTAHKVDVYAPAKDLTSSNATWDDWSGASLGGLVDQRNVAYGYSGCADHGVDFDVVSTIRSDVTANNKSRTFVIKADSESDETAWKRFSSGSPAPSLTITYDHAPNTPTGMYTQPATSCSSVKTVGDGNVELDAPVSDKDGGNLSVSFQMWKTSDTTKTRLWPTSSTPLSVPSGSTARTIVPESSLRVWSGGAAATVTQFSWQVKVADSDGLATAFAPTTPCSFLFDPTRQGPPTVSQPDGTTIGTPVTITVSPPATGTVPSNYMYQLNTSAPVTVPATNGTATFSVTPNRVTNILTVTSLSAGLNLGDQATVAFTSRPAATAGDADFDGDGRSDLIAVGGAAGLPAGLWQSRGIGNNRISPLATNIGVNGNGVSGNAGGTDLARSSADFDGAQTISGHFTGAGVQDVLAYYPGGINAGMGIIIAGQGDGSALRADLSGNEWTDPAGTFTDAFGNNPTQLVNAGNSEGIARAYPDLLGVAGDAVNGHYLAYYPNSDSIGGYAAVDILNVPSPDGTLDWDTWRLASAQTAAGTALFLWQPSTGALSLWTGLSHMDGDVDLAHTQHTLAAANWNKNAAVTLRAADINGDATADLWGIGANGAATAYLVTGLTGTPSIGAQPVQSVNTATHTWSLNDTTTGSVGTNGAADTTNTTALPASGYASGHAAFDNGDLFSPDVALDGTASTGLFTASAPVSTNADFTVSVWARPDAAGGTVLSVDGANTYGFQITASSADKSWRLMMPRTDVATPTVDSISAGANTVQLGVWVHLTATFQSGGSLMALYINDKRVASGVHTTPWRAANGLQIGDYKSGASAHSGWFTGHVALAQAWNAILTPSESGLYQLTDRSGTTAADSSGLARTATLSGGYTWNSTGHDAAHAGSLHLNGTTGYATASTHLLTTNQSYTLTAWVKLADKNAQHTVLAQNGATRSPFYLQFDDTSNKWRLFISSADVSKPTWYNAASTTITPTVGVWVHLAGVYNASTHTSTLYVNGQIQGSASGITTWNSTDSTWIGRSSATYFSGDIDSVHVFQTALTQQQVQAVMNS